MNVFSDPDLPAGAVRLFGAYCTFDQGRGCFASTETVAKLVHMAAGTVKQYRALLARRGYLTVQRRKDLPGIVRVSPEARDYSGFKEISTTHVNNDSTPYKVEGMGEAVESKGETHDSEAGTGSSGPDQAARRSVSPFKNLNLSPDGSNLAAELRASGVRAGPARSLVLEYPARRIRAALIAVGSRGDVWNPGGWVRRAVVEDWKLPVRCYRGAEAGTDPESAPLPAVTPAAPDLEPGEGILPTQPGWAEAVRAEMFGFVEPDLGRPWSQIREGLTPEQRQICEIGELRGAN